MMAEALEAISKFNPSLSDAYLRALCRCFDLDYEELGKYL